MRKCSTLTILMTAAIVFVISCQKETSKPAEESFDTAFVKEWYYSTFKKSPEWATQNTFANGKKLPDWKTGKSKKFGAYEVVDFTLVKEKSTIGFFSNSLLTTGDKRKISAASIQHITFIRNKAGKIDVREITYIPDMDYLDRHHYDISNNSFADIDNDFCGMMIVRKWNGSEISRSVIKEGKIIKRLKKQNTGGANKTARIEDMICIDEWARDCESHLYGDGMFTYECGEWYLTGNQYCFDDGEIEDPCAVNPESPECGACVLYGIGCDDGGDEPPPCTQESIDGFVNELLSGAISLNEKTSIETLSADPTTITRKYHWKFYSIQSAFEGITFTSHETGVQNWYPDGYWRFTSFAHSDVTSSGGAWIWDATVNSLTPNPSISTFSTGGSLPAIVSIGYITLDYVIKVTYSCGPFSRTTYPNGTSTNSWYTYEQ